ncbi:MAG: hypothetical protein Kow00128_22220 [Deltaproteobacteria bacterium]
MRGVTLLELVVVLVILGLVASLAAPSISGTLGAGRLRSGASDLRAVFTRARTLAVAEARPRVVRVEVAGRRFGVDGEESRRLPDGVSVASARIGAKPVEEERFRVRFYPDGSADGAEVILASEGGGTLRVAVDPLTGIAEAVR